MKRLLWVIAIALVVSPRPARSQDGGGFEPLFSDDIFNGDFGGGDGNRGNRGGRGNQQQQQPAVDRLVGIRNLMAKANAPLTKDQEKALNTVLDTELPVV